MKPYFETPNGKIFHGNCLDILPELEAVDLTVTSPPYDNLRDYEGYDFDFEKIAVELFRVTKEGGVVVWVVGDATIDGSETGTSFKQALYFKELGFNLHDTMIYHNTGLTLNHKRYEQEFEYMFIFTKGYLTTFNPIKTPCLWYNKEPDRTGQTMKIHNEIFKKGRSGSLRGKIKQEKIKGNIWNYQTGYAKSSKDKIAFEHPAIFPEQLTHDHIISWSNENDLVLDPMAGSGTVPKMCERLNRKWVACEISEKYCEIAAKRITHERSQRKLNGF